MCKFLWIIFVFLIEFRKLFFKRTRKKYVFVGFFQVGLKITPYDIYNTLVAKFAFFYSISRATYTL